ncbi:hypothetical protein HHK36_010429 [Tetracentron sinense]|uniref:Endonuclease/exonuclease/phosphatase domain-containing protein n=1 Tax=Tetracentron sinense TaxID=13715 RepID=A0A834ZEW0_TETSI|nr:hypothetical protein HHK36_010429 [Tetracentron sinense]
MCKSDGNPKGLIGQYAVPILEEKSVWGTDAPTRIAHLDSKDITRLTFIALRNEKIDRKLLTSTGPWAWTTQEVITLCKRLAGQDANGTMVCVSVFKFIRQLTHFFEWTNVVAGRLAFSKVTNPSAMWESHLEDLTDDLQHQVRSSQPPLDQAPVPMADGSESAIEGNSEPPLSPTDFNSGPLLTGLVFPDSIVLNTSSTTIVCLFGPNQQGLSTLTSFPPQGLLAHKKLFPPLSSTGPIPQYQHMANGCLKRVLSRKRRGSSHIHHPYSTWAKKQKIHQIAIRFGSSVQYAESVMKRWQIKLQFEEMAVVNPIGTAGGLCVFWKAPWWVEVLHSTGHIIHLRVKDREGAQSWYLSLVYGPPVESERQRFWAELACSTPKDRDHLWLGDFNEVLFNFEKKGGIPKTPAQLEVLSGFVRAQGLLDLGFQGNPFSWTNKRVGRDNVRERLDRALCSVAWRLRFDSAMVSHLPMVGSDHCPLLVHLQP